LEPEKEEDKAEETEEEEEEEEAEGIPKQGQVRAIYGYAGHLPGTLVYEEGAIINLKKKSDHGDWWYGELDGVNGWFSKLHVIELTKEVAKQENDKDLAKKQLGLLLMLNEICHLLAKTFALFRYQALILEKFFCVEVGG